MSVTAHQGNLPVLALGPVRESMRTELDQLGIACRFYGFDLVSEQELPSAPALVILHAGDADRVSASEWLTWMNQARSYGAPVGIVGLTNRFPCDFFRPMGIDPPPRLVSIEGNTAVRVTARDHREIGFEFADIGLPAGKAATTGLAFPQPVRGRALAVLANSERESEALVRFATHPATLYLMVRTAAADPATNTEWQFRWSRFGELLPYLLLLRDVGGERCWRSCAPVANLTIDDPWLIEPYGCLSFPRLLARMRHVGFHATIGFVPWNYDRSSDAVVQLLADHPEHFSLAVHGNNHDRYEFYRYRHERGDFHRAKSLAEQEFNIRQALARMNTFQRHTDLAYDRVMVFPHGICPAPTLRVLKENGFWATANFRNVPLGHPAPSDPAVILRTVHTDCAGFPAMRRLYPQNYSDAAIATDLFLGNPVLFMSHHDLFSAGIDAFDEVAARVNRRQPAVRWSGLGEISRQLHRVRRTGPTSFQVQMSSCHARVNNPAGDAAEFTFGKEEPSDQAIAEVTIAGERVPWTHEAKVLRFSARLEPGSDALVEIRYAASAQTDGVDIQRRGLRNRTLRFAADFRDLTMSRSKYGRHLIALVARHHPVASAGLTLSPRAAR